MLACADRHRGWSSTGAVFDRGETGAAQASGSGVRRLENGTGERVAPIDATCESGLEEVVLYWI